MESRYDIDMLTEYVLQRIKEEMRHRTQRYVIAESLSIDEMIAAAGGMSINPKTEVMRKALLQGENVYCLEEGLEYLNYKTTANKEYLKRLEHYTEQLKSYGVIFFKDGNSLKRFLAQGEALKQKRLITAKTAEELQGGSILTVSRATVITPSADDILKEKNITVLIR